MNKKDPHQTFTYYVYKGRKINMSHSHTFQCKCFVLNNDNDNLQKVDAKLYETILLTYSPSSKYVEFTVQKINN